MKNKLISDIDKQWMSFFFSLMILTFFSNVIFNSVDKVIPKFDNISGTVYGYTQDSVYVDVNWEVNYNYNKRHTKYTKEELENEINYMMTERITVLINDIMFWEYVIIDGHPIITNNNGIKIKMFK